MHKITRWTLIITGLGVITAIGTCRSYSTKDLIENYKLKGREINAVKRYINSIVPPGEHVDIEFDGRNTLAIFHIRVNGYYENNWDVNVSAPKTDTLLQQLGWTKETLMTLKNKLDDANCISVESGEPCSIGYQRSGMGKYHYLLFDQSIADSLKSDYNDSCHYILYNDKVVLEYGGGAVGPQCFPGY